jgi:hypothetical protein
MCACCCWHGIPCRSCYGIPFFLFVIDVGCCQHDCLAVTVAGVPEVACIPAVIGVLLLVVSLFVPGVGMTSVPNVQADADVPAPTYIHVVALYLLLLASLLSMTSLLCEWNIEHLATRKTDILFNIGFRFDDLSFGTAPLILQLQLKTARKLQIGSSLIVILSDG